MKLKKVFAGAFLAFVFCLSFTAPILAAETPQSTPVKESAFFTGMHPTCLQCGNCDTCDLIQLFINASRIILGFTGAAALLMFVIGCIMMITAYCHEDRVKMGKDTLIAAMTGIIIILISWIIMNAVIMGITNNQFNITKLLERPELKCENAPPSCPNGTANTTQQKKSNTPNNEILNDD